MSTIESHVPSPRHVIAGLALVGVLLSSIAILPAGEADAGPAWLITYFYFSDPSRQHVVGIREYTCSNGVITTGEVTPIYTRNMEPCE